MSATLLFEIGLEELPASFVHGALAAMPGLAEKALESARLGHGAVRALGTPRRLSLVVEELADKQTDLAETVLGPPERAAFDEEGKPKKAALGFAKKLGIEVDALTIEETDKGRYVAGRRDERGQDCRQVIAPLLEELATKIPFPKSMRWGAGEHSFGRPVHWLVVLYGADILDVSLFGVRSGRLSLGHRFLAPEPVEIESASCYVDTLRSVHVLVDPEERERVMCDRLLEEASGANGVFVEDSFLVAENGTMVEEPHVICGSFDEAFLELPDEVTIEVMRGHQRYFALRDTGGKLMPRYLAVINTNSARDIITRGNDRVLSARLADGRFFVDEDKKVGLEAMVPELDQVVFQTKLGSVGERIPRLSALVASLGDPDVGPDGDPDGGPARAAARLCKADLVSLIVGEFPELQGMMGAYYARGEGIDENVAEAIEEHYKPRDASDTLPRSKVSARLAVADRADTLVGCFGLGLIPSGSADPFALRRATLGIVRIALEGPIDVDVEGTLAAAYDAYVAQDKPLKDKAEVLGSLNEFFRGRLRKHLGDGRPTDLVDACLGAWPGTSLRDLRARLDALDAFAKLPAYESLAVAFKRAHNIVKSADFEEGPFDVAAASEDAERKLAETWAALDADIARAIEAGDYREALEQVAERLKGPIDTFFDDVLVMHDDAAVRTNRLRLLAAIAGRLSTIAHFHALAGR